MIFYVNANNILKLLDKNKYIVYNKDRKWDKESDKWARV